MYIKSVALTSLAAAAVSAQSLTEVLSGTPELSNLTTLVTSLGGLAAELSEATDITILAPSNDALATFSRSQVGSRLLGSNDSTLLEGVLRYHVLPSVIQSSDFQTVPVFAPTLLDSPVFTNVTGGQVVQGALNGSDVVITSGLKLNSNVVTADVSFDGGIVHIIDSVLTVPPSISTSAGVLGLSILRTLLIRTGLASTVDELKDVTVFAPSNGAFNASAEALSALDADGVSAVLQNHVVAGAVGYSSNLEDGQVLETVGGATIQITIRDGSVFANGVQVITPDVLVANGVVHVIDGVLPQGNATTGRPTPTGGATPSGTGVTGTNGGTGSPIASYVPGGAASSVQASMTGLAALFMAALVFVNA